MEQEKNGHRVVDLNDLFGGETIVTLSIKDIAVRYHFIEKTSAIDQEHLRRASNIKARNGKAEPTEQSITADLWLFDQLCKKVEVFEHGAGSMEQGAWIDVPDFKARLMPDSKRTALNLYNQRISRGDNEGN